MWDVVFGIQKQTKAYTQLLGIFNFERPSNFCTFDIKYVGTLPKQQLKQKSMARKKHMSPQRITAHYMYGDQEFEHFVGEGVYDTFTKFWDDVDAKKVSSVTLDLHVKDLDDVKQLQSDIKTLKAIFDD